MSASCNCQASKLLVLVIHDLDKNKEALMKKRLTIFLSLGLTKRNEIHQEIIAIFVHNFLPGKKFVCLSRLMDLWCCSNKPY